MLSTKVHAEGDGHPKPSQVLPEENVQPIAGEAKVSESTPIKKPDNPALESKSESVNAAQKKPAAEQGQQNTQDSDKAAAIKTIKRYYLKHRVKLWLMIDCNKQKRRYMTLVQQLQNYTNTQGLAKLYNEAERFKADCRHRLENDLLTDHVRQTWESYVRNLSQYQADLIRVADNVRLQYMNSIQSPEQIMELAHLGALHERDSEGHDKFDINTKVYNLFMEELQHQLSPSHASILRRPLLQGFVVFLKDLPNTFMTEKLSDIIGLITHHLYPKIEHHYQALDHGQLTQDAKQDLPLLFEGLCRILDAIVDNRYLQAVSYQYDESGLNDLSEQFVHLSHVPAPNITRPSVNTGNDASTVVKQAGKQSAQQIQSLFTPEILKAGAQDMSKLVIDLVTGGEGEGGLTRDQLNELNHPLKPFIKHDEDHEIPADIRFLAKYARQAIAQIPCADDPSPLQDTFRRGAHLFMGAKSMAMIVASQGLALTEYQQALTHFQAAYEGTVLTDNKEPWYPMARELESLFAETKSELDRYLALFDSLEAILKRAGQDATWPLFYTCISRFDYMLDNSDDETLQHRIVSFIRQVFQDKQHYGKDAKKRTLALQTLVRWASHPSAYTAQQAKTTLEQLQQRYQMKRISQAKRLLNEYVPVDVSGLRASSQRYTPQLISLDHELLDAARQLATPIEFQLLQTRQQLDQYRGLVHLDDQLQNYVMMRWSRNRTDTEAEKSRLIETVESFLDHPTEQVLLIQGEAGSGKSLFGRYLERQLWQQYERGGMVPLFISLPALEEPTRQAVEQALLSYGWDPHLIQQFKQECMDQAVEMLESIKAQEVKGAEESAESKEDEEQAENKEDEKEPQENQAVKQAKHGRFRFIIYLDGYDEIRTQSNLFRSNQLALWGAKVIISARSEYLESISTSRATYLSHFMPESQVGQGDLTKQSSVRELYIRAFEPSQVNEFVEKIAKFNREKAKDEGLDERLVWTAQRYQTAIETIPGIKELVQHPFILQIITEVLPALQMRREQGGLSGRISRAEVYEQFIEQWFARESERIDTSDIPVGFKLKESFWTHSMDVARFMYLNSMQTIRGEASSYRSYTQKAVTRAEGVHLVSGDDKVQLAFKGAPLKAMGADVYGFIHKSLYEYFLAKLMFDEVVTAYYDGVEAYTKYLKAFESATDAMPAEAMGIPTPHEVLLNYTKEDFEHPELAHALHEEASVIYFMNDMIETDVRHREAFMALVKQSKWDKAIGQASANAATILNTMHCSFSGEDLSHTELAGAKLDYALMDHTNLSWANLTGTSMRSSILSNAKLDHTDVEGLTFYEPSIMSIGTSAQRGECTPVATVFLDESRQEIITTSKHGDVHYWNNQGECIAQVHPPLIDHKNQETVSEVGQYFLVHGNNKNLWLFDKENDWQRPAHLYDGIADVKEFKFSPDNQLLVIITVNQVLRLFLAENDWQEPLNLKGGIADVESYLINPQHHSVVISSNMNTMLIEGGNEWQAIELLSNDAVDLEFTPDGQWLLVSWAHSQSSSRAIYLFNKEDDWKKPAHLENGINKIWRYQDNIFSPDGRFLVLENHESAKNIIKLFIFDRRDNYHSPEMFADGISVDKYHFSPDGQYLVVKIFNGPMRLLDVNNNWQAPAEFNWDISNISYCYFSPDSRFLLCSNDYKNDTLQIFDRENHWQMPACLNEGITNINHHQINPDDTHLLVKDTSESAKGTLRLFDLANESQISTELSEGVSNVYSQFFSPDGRILIVQLKRENEGDQYALKFYDRKQNWAESFEVLMNIGNWFSNAFSPDGRFLVVSTHLQNSSARFWFFDMEHGGQELSELEKGIEMGTNADARNCIFSLDSRFMVLSFNGMDLYDLQNNGRRVSHFEGLSSLVFSLDSQFFATLKEKSGSSEVRLYDLRNFKDLDDYLMMREFKASGRLQFSEEYLSFGSNYYCNFYYHLSTSEWKVFFSFISSEREHNNFSEPVHFKIHHDEQLRLVNPNWCCLVNKEGYQFIIDQDSKWDDMRQSEHGMLSLQQKAICDDFSVEYENNQIQVYQLDGQKSVPYGLPITGLTNIVGSHLIKSKMLESGQLVEQYMLQAYTSDYQQFTWPVLKQERLATPHLSATESILDINLISESQVLIHGGGQLYIWDMMSQMLCCPVMEEVGRVEFSSQQRFLIAGSNRTWYFLDREQDFQLYTGFSDATKKHSLVQLSPDKSVLVLEARKDITVEGRGVYKHKFNFLCNMNEFYGERKWYRINDWDSTVSVEKIFNADSSAQSCLLNKTIKRRISFSPNSRFLLAKDRSDYDCEDTIVTLVELWLYDRENDWQQPFLLNDDYTHHTGSGSIDSLDASEFSPDSRFLIVKINGYPEQFYFRMFDLSQGIKLCQLINEENKEITEHTEINGYRFSPDSSALAIAYWSKSQGNESQYVIEMYDLNNFQSLKRFTRTLSDNFLGEYQFSSNGRYFFVLLERKSEVTKNDTLFQLFEQNHDWEVQPVDFIQVLRDDRDYESFNHCEFSLDNRYLIASGHNIYIIDLESTAPKKVFLVNSFNVSFDSFLFSPDWQYLAIKRNKHFAFNYSSDEWQKCIHFPASHSDIKEYRFSPDSRYLVAKEIVQHTLRIFDVNTSLQMPGELCKSHNEILTHISIEDALEYEFIARAHWLIVKGIIISKHKDKSTNKDIFNRTIRVYDYSEQVKLIKEIANVTTYEFLPDYRGLITGHHDGVVRVWIKHEDTLMLHQIYGPYQLDLNGLQASNLHNLGQDNRVLFERSGAEVSQSDGEEAAVSRQVRPSLRQTMVQSDETHDQPTAQMFLQMMQTMGSMQTAFESRISGFEQSVQTKISGLEQSTQALSTYLQSGSAATLFSAAKTTEEESKQEFSLTAQSS